MSKVITPEAQHAVEIREVRPSDRAVLERFYRDLSDDSRHARFLAVSRGISGPAARSFCTLDHVHDQGFVASVGSGEQERIVGHVCLILTSPQELELGIAVADGYQGRGVGRRLFEAALAWAQARHFAAINASCLAENSRVLALLTSAPNGVVFRSSGAGVVDVTVPLEPGLPSQLVPWPEGARPSRRRSSAHQVRPARVWRQPLLRS